MYILVIDPLSEGSFAIIFSHSIVFLYFFVLIAEEGSLIFPC